MNFVYKNGLKYLKFDIFPSEVIHGIFTRNGGLSVDPWNSLNVGGTVGDDNTVVKKNRMKSFDAAGRETNSMFDVWQVHSADIVIANAPHSSKKDKELRADGILTDNPEISLFMRFADCTPIMLYDTQLKIVGIVHAGWQGTIKKVVSQAVKSMKANFDSNPENILAGIGPSIGPDHYEIGQDVIEHVKHAFGSRSEELLIKNGEKYHFDLWNANKINLEEAGVTKIEIARICTACNLDDWFSHRAEKGKTGRFGAIIALNQAASF
ncbi:MAG: peptidoglycan editing factor PgeF [Chloroflexota bacterium]